MARVPYTGVPTIGPSGQLLPFQRAPSGLEEAAGVGVAKAFQGLGGQIEHAGDTIASSVLAFQNLQNETDAKNADVDVMVKIGQAQSEFDQLEGDQAVKSLPGHMDRIKKIRQEALDGMPNPAARRLLDNSISRRVGFAIVDSGHKAGTQAKVAADQASGARVDAAKRQFDPSSPETARTVERTLEAEIRQKGEERGMRPETVDNIVSKEKSMMWLGGIQKMARNDPEGAQEYFERIKDKMEPGPREQAQTIISNNIAGKQSRVDAQDILRKSGFDPSKGPGQEQKLLDLAEKYKEKHKDNPAYADYLDAHVKGLYATSMQGYRDTQNGYEHTIGKFILGQDDNNRVVSIDGIIGPDAPKEVRDAYQGMEPTKQKKVLSWVKQIAAGGHLLTPERLIKEQQLKGMASDPETATDFVNMGVEGIMKENLTLQQTRSLLDLQRKLGTSPQFIDSYVNKAMRQIAPMLEAAKVTLKDNREGYLQFRGAFEDVIRDRMGDKGVLPPQKEIEAMGSQLLQDQHKDKWYRFKSEIFRGADVPDTIRSEIEKSYRAQGISDPTDEQIARAYSLVLFKRAYANPKAPKGSKE